MILLCYLLLFIIIYFLIYEKVPEHFKNFQEYIPRIVHDPLKLIKYKKENPNYDIQSNKVYSINKSYSTKYNPEKFKINNKKHFEIKINSPPKNQNVIYKLYGEDNLTFKKAGVIDNPKNIDQTTNINIMNHTNNNIGKTIKDLYDEITNDNRTQDISNLEPFDSLDNYIIDNKINYGNTNFNTY